MKHKSLLLLLFIIIIASFLRLYQITDFPPGLYPDEAMNGNNALEALSTGEFKMFYPENNGREGFFINIQALSVFLFGNFPWALRLISALFGILTVLGVYLLTKELFSRNKELSEEAGEGKEVLQDTSKFKIPYIEAIALLSSFLIATSFWHIIFSRIGFRAIMAPFFLVWALYFLLLAIRKLEGKYSYWKLGIIAGLLFGLGFHSYIAYRATPLIVLAIFFYVWLKNKNSFLRKNLCKLFSVFVIASIIAFLPLGIYFLKNPEDFFGRTSQISVFSSESPTKDLTQNILKTAAMFNFKSDGNWRHNYAERPQLFWPVGIMFIAGILCSISLSLRRQKCGEIAKKPEMIIPTMPPPPPSPERPITAFDNLPVHKEPEPPPPPTIMEKVCGPATDKLPFIILFSWIIVATFPIIISNEGLPHALRAIILIPAVFILAGFGGIQFFNRVIKKIFKSSHGRVIFAVIILAFLLLEGYYTYFKKWGINEHVLGAFNQNYVDIGKELNSLPKELMKFVVVKAGGVDVRGVPMPSQTVMFITDTFTPDKQKEKNIFYVLPEKMYELPDNSYSIILE